MLEKLSQWIKKKIRAWLFDAEYLIGADYGYYDSAIAIIRRDKKTGDISVIQDTHARGMYVQDFLREIHRLVKKYNVPDNNVIRDFPLGFKSEHYGQE